MPLFIAFGINGSGKDTLAKQLLDKYPEYTLLSGSRIMLRGLGLDVGITAQSPASREMYQALEQTPEEVKQKIMDKEYKNTLQEFKRTDQVGILLGHLVVAIEKNGAMTYEKDMIRSWFPEVFNGFVYVKGDPVQIYNRHLKDKNENTRDRGFSTVETLIEQQELSTHEWEKLKHIVPSEQMKTIYNLDGKLESASEALENFISVRLRENKEQHGEFKPHLKFR